MKTRVQCAFATFWTIAMKSKIKVALPNYHN